jgi:hypothetical protein
MLIADEGQVPHSAGDGFLIVLWPENIVTLLVLVGTNIYAQDKNLKGVVDSLLRILFIRN